VSSSASPVLTVCGSTYIARTRRVPPGAKLMVKCNDRVRATDVVATAEVPGQMVSVDAAAMLGVVKSRIGDYLKIGEGDLLTEGQEMGRRDALFGLVRTILRAPLSGTVESISRVSGHVMIREAPHPVNVVAYINGTVETLNEKKGVTVAANGALVQGVFGVGNEVTGMLCSTANDEMTGRIVCAFESIDEEALHHFRDAGAIGVIAPGIDGKALTDFCGTQLNPAATGDEDVGLTMVFTEGFGALPMGTKTKNILRALVNREVSMSGVTQVRAGVIRPELIGPAVDGMDDALTGRDIERRVRILRGKYMGREASIVDEPAAPQRLPSGISTLVYKVKLIDSDEVFSVPRVNVE
jgi:hypothetical protein